MKSRTIKELLAPNRVELLNLCLAPYLPPSTEWKDKPTNALPPGHHFIYFPTSTSEGDMLEDGYEKHFAPKHPYKRRVWTQGRLHFQGKGLTIGEWAKCYERLFDADEKTTYTNVWIERKMYDDPEKSGKDDWSVRELRCLRYVREIPAVKEKKLPLAGPGTPLFGPWERDALLTHKFTPTNSLLTEFSNLTNNSHRIHIDTEYARTVEQYPDVLVHGSLSISYILRAVSELHDSKGQKLKIRLARYVMFRPLYVNRPVTLTITATISLNKRAVLWDEHNQKAVECIISLVP
jgi:hydroxyacyl-ACP dehydratase HTD2-like protein with hotdog domain